jgi:hypothetical protein
MAHHNIPYDICNIPMHRLNTPATKMWFIGGALRRQIASALAKRYRSGCGVLTRTLYLIAFVAPDERIRELAPPHRQFEMWQIANQPSPQDCQCSIFYDPESGGPWLGNPKSQTHHHPVCQFERAAKPTFRQAQQQAIARLRDGKSAQERPDEWESIRKSYQGR